MTIRYVGIGGNNSNDGLSWANRKLTFAGVEATVEAGDTVYVGAGTYYGTFIIGVSGSSGSPITYIGDTDGSHTDGIGGIIRLSGLAADEKTYSNGVGLIKFAIAKDFRTFNNFYFDGALNAFYIDAACSDITLNNCIFNGATGNAYTIRADKVPANITINNCIFMAGYGGGTGTNIKLGATDKNDSAYLIQNCLFIGTMAGVYSNGCGNVTVKNCTFYHTRYGARTSAVNTSYPMIVNNCLFYGCDKAMYSSSASQITENYNNVINCDVARTNVAVGANSLAYPTNLDVRWASELLWFNGSMATPFDLASYSALIDVAGTSPTAADLRGTTVQGTQREWGVLEYDSTLDIEAGSGGGGGAVSIQPLSGRLGL